MGYFKEMDIDIQNEERDSELRELELDMDINWWRMQDEEMQREEHEAYIKQMELDAEVWMLRSLGAM